MKKTIVLAMMALAVVALPTTAQSRKDKKAAEKAAWEMKQQQQAEEAALLHQMKMDSIRDAQAAREAAKAEAEAKKAAEDARARKIQEKEDMIEEWEGINIPCFVNDDENYFYQQASRTRKMSQINTLQTSVLNVAIQALQMKVRGALKQVTRSYFNQMDMDDQSAEASHIENAAERVTKMCINDYEEYCRKMVPDKASGNVTMHIGIRLSKKEVVQKLEKEITEEQAKGLRVDHEALRNSYPELFNGSVE